MKNDGSLGKSILLKAALLLGAAGLIFMAVAIYGEMSRKKQIQEEIENLQQEAERISRENALAQDRLAYLESHDYKEKEAKDKLNLQSPDENVVIVEPGVVKDDTSSTDDQVQIPVSVPQKSNYLKWFDYFFKY